MIGRKIFSCACFAAEYGAVSLSVRSIMPGDIRKGAGLSGISELVRVYELR